jgi:hypothetical protein
MESREVSLKVCYYFETLLWWLDGSKLSRQLVATAILNLDNMAASAVILN